MLILSVTFRIKNNFNIQEMFLLFKYSDNFLFFFKFIFFEKF